MIEPKCRALVSLALPCCSALHTQVLFSRGDFGWARSCRGCIRSCVFPSCTTSKCLLFQSAPRLVLSGRTTTELTCYVSPPPPVFLRSCSAFFFRATAPELHFTVYEYQLSAAEKDHGNLLKANQVNYLTDAVCCVFVAHAIQYQSQGSAKPCEPWLLFLTKRRG